MRKKTIFILIILISIFSCTKEKSSNIKTITFKGAVVEIDNSNNRVAIGNAIVTLARYDDGSSDIASDSTNYKGEYKFTAKVDLNQYHYMLCKWKDSTIYKFIDEYTIEEPNHEISFEF